MTMSASPLAAFSKNRGSARGHRQFAAVEARRLFGYFRETHGFLPRQRMMRRDQLLQAVAHDMGIDLRGGDVGVAEHFLDAAQIGAVLQQMAGEGVAQHVGRQALRVEPGIERQLLQQLRATLARQMAAAAARRKQIARFRLGLEERAARREIGVERARAPAGDSGTSRSLSPLPRTRRKRLSPRAAASGSPTNSDTRRPEP